MARKPGSRGYYAAQFRHVFGRSLESAWADWIVAEKAFQQKNLEAIRQYPITPHSDLDHPRAGLGVARLLRPDTRSRSTPPSTIRAWSRTSARLDVKTGEVERIVRLKGPMIYTVASLAYDPRDGILYYTTDNGDYRDLVRLDPQTGKTTAAAEGRAHRRARLQHGRRRRSAGIRHLNGLCTIVRMQAPYTEWTRVGDTSRTATVAYDLDVSPDGSKIVAAFGEIDGKMDVRVVLAKPRRCLKGDTTAAQTLRFRHRRCPSSFIFSPDGALRLRHVVLTGVSNVFRYELATRRDRGGQQHRDRILPPDSPGRRPAGRLPLHRAGPGARRASPARRSRTRRRSRFSASGLPRKSRSCARGLPGRRRTSRGRRCRRRTASTGWPAGSSPSRSTRSSRATRSSPAVGMRVEPVGSRCSSIA